MDIKLPKEVLGVLEKLGNKGFKPYIVGGAVRDLLMGKEGLPAGRQVSDFDFTTDAKPEEILKIFPEGFYDNKFGTVGVIARGDAKERSQASTASESSNEDAPEIPKRQDPEQNQIFEITTMRKEGNYRDHRHPVEVSWTKNIKEDLARRDFTINAIALSPVIPSDSEKSQDYKWEIIDPFYGQVDLKEKLIKTVGDADERFKEDSLRLMRAIRISSQLGFEIENKTYVAIKKNAELIKEVANERTRDELFKLLASDNAYEGLLKLEETGILEIILPELMETKNIIQEGPKHDRVYEILDHSFRAMREAPSKEPLVKFAALLHDVGKKKTFKKDAEGNVTFYNHDTVGAKIALDIAKRFNLSKKQTDKLYRLIRWHMFSTNENQTDSAIRRFIKNVGLENLEDMFAIRIGDRLGGDTRNPVSWRMEQFQEKIKQVLIKPFSITDLKINGKDVMEILDIPPSRKVGEVLDVLFKEVLKDASKNNKDYLLLRIKELA